jgi:isocitrate lyase
VERTYSAEDVVRLRGTVQVEHTLARHGAEKFWRLVNQEQPLCGLGALTGNQAIQEVQAGLKAIYCSGWRSTPFRRWCSGSTMPCSAPTRSTR